MAHVFISYERSTEVTARAAAEALTARGHRTWTDDLIPPHRDYTDVIEEHLTAVDVVLVLWSQSAAKSLWVRAEADYAREHGKLVQGVLDRSDPPMPFNRIQCAKLDGWKGEPDHREWLKVIESIEQVASGADGQAMAQPPRAVADASPQPVRSRNWGWALGGLAAIALAGVAVWLAGGHLDRSTPPAAKIAVLPFATLSAGDEARYFADGLTDQILTTLSNNRIQVVSRDDAVLLKGPDRDRLIEQLAVARLLSGTVRRDGETIAVRVHLDDPIRHAVLWSKEIDGASAQSAELQVQVATTIVNVLMYANRALRPVNGLSDPALLARYLHAADLFANPGALTVRHRDLIEILTALREVTARAPNFAPAHGELAKIAAAIAPLGPPEQAAAIRQEADEHARVAIALESNTPDAYLAQARLLPTSRWAERERLLRQALEIDPTWPETNGALAGMLSAVGRLKDALEFARATSAADQSPLDVFAAGVAGQTGPCIDGLSKMLKREPANALAWYFLLTCQATAEHWDAALAMLASPTAPTSGTPLGDAFTATYTAAKTRAPADLARARDLSLALAAENPFDLQAAISILALLGFADDAFALEERYSPDTDGENVILFLKGTDSMRRSPRFMTLAKRIGLVDYWQIGGHWPDFCDEPDLPYDCRAEAAKQ